ncbi:MAG: FG-GAP-like repeat-containing protein [Kiritimatiellaeota bacterium]|nr:FG-GAP-like repeat-containing protein [Kiritimatiellota bacterium]
MKTAVVLVGLLVALAISAQADSAAPISIVQFAVTNADNAAGSNVTITAAIVVTNIADFCQVILKVKSTNNLVGQVFPPQDLVFVPYTPPPGVGAGGDYGICYWTNTSWNPYFNGAFNVTVVALDLADIIPSQDVSATAVTVVRTIGGTMNSVKVQEDVSATAVFVNIDTNQVFVHTLGLNSAGAGVFSIPLNLMNNTNPVWVSDQQMDIAYMDTGAYKSNGTPFRFDMDMHARPTSMMGFGEIMRFVWTPTVATNPAGSGNLKVDVVSRQPWRSGYTTNFQAHVGCAPLFVADTNVAATMEGMIMSTTAHYADVSPVKDEVYGIGLKVNGQSNKTSNLKAFIPDAILVNTFGITNADMATNMLVGYTTHFDSNDVSKGDTVAVTTTFTNIVAGGDPVVVERPMYAYYSTNGDAGLEATFTFQFQSPVAAQMGLIIEEATITPLAADFDNDRKADMALVLTNGYWKIWWSTAGYTPYSSAAPLYVAGGVPLAADFDNDHKADPCMVGPDGIWTIWWSTLDYRPFSSAAPIYVADGVPLAADFDNDHKADMAMVGPDGTWTIWWSTADYTPYSSAVPLYVAGGVPVAADFDKDGRADPCMVAPDGYWKIWWSTADYTPYSSAAPFCVDGGVPVAADFDKDGRADPTVVGPDGVWTILQSKEDYTPVHTIPLLP